MSSFQTAYSDSPGKVYMHKIFDFYIFLVSDLKP